MITLIALQGVLHRVRTFPDSRTGSDEYEYEELGENITLHKPMRRGNSAPTDWAEAAFIKCCNKSNVPCANDICRFHNGRSSYFKHLL